MQRWLMKTEPDTFSIDDLRTRKVEPWNGVRNYQARNFIRSMRRGDPVMIYHSSCAVPGIAGLARVSSAPYPDPGQFDPGDEYFDPGSDRADPRWTLVDVRFVRKLKRTITLDELKGHDALDEMQLLRKGNRLSVMPVAATEWRYILTLE